MFLCSDDNDTKCSKLLKASLRGKSGNKYAIAVSYLCLIAYKNITIIKYTSYRRDKTNEARGGSGPQDKILHISHIYRESTVLS